MRVSFFVLAITALLSLNTLSHPGRTDANGGHWDKKNGTYHFHTGEYAGKGSSSNSNNEYEYEPFTPPYEPPTENPYRQNTETDTSEPQDNEKKSSGLKYLIFIGVVLLLDSLPGIFSYISEKKNSKNHKEQNEPEEENKENEDFVRHKHLMIPVTPHELEEEGYVYRVSDGQRYHRLHCKTINGKQKYKLLFEDAKNNNMLPCKVCAPSLSSNSLNTDILPEPVISPIFITEKRYVTMSKQSSFVKNRKEYTLPADIEIINDEFVIRQIHFPNGGHLTFENHDVLVLNQEIKAVDHHETEYYITLSDKIIK